MLGHDNLPVTRVFKPLPFKNRDDLRDNYTGLGKRGVDDVPFTLTSPAKQPRLDSSTEVDFRLKSTGPIKPSFNSDSSREGDRNTFPTRSADFSALESPGNKVSISCNVEGD